MADNTEKPLLDLTTDRFVANITIDEVPYGLLHGDNLSILQQQELRELGNKLTKASTNITEEKHEKRYNDIMCSILCLIMPDASKKLIERLSIMKKFQAIEAYNTVTEKLKKKMSKPKKKAS